MFNVGGMELVVIALVALVVLGPDKLPGAIRQFGQVVGELRRISRGFQTDLRGALDEAERDAAAKQADAAGPSPDNHDPGAAEAVAQAELAAIEGAREARAAASDGADDIVDADPPAPETSTDTLGSERSPVTPELPRASAPGVDRPGPAS